MIEKKSQNINRSMLNQLWIFYSVALHESFSAAASNLFLTQPNISTQVKQLENYYGTRLFERYGKKIKLTEAGEKLFSYAEKIFSLIREADSVIQDIRGMKSGSLRVSASLTMGTYYLPYMLSNFRKQCPNIEIQMTVGNSESVIQDILTMKSDLGMVAHLVDNENLTSYPFLEDELVMIVSTQHEFAKRDYITLGELNNQSFIMREKGSATRNEIESKLRESNIKVNIIMELASNEAIKHAVEVGLGISVLPADVVKKEVELKLLKIVRFSKKKFTRNFYMIHHKDKYLSNAMKSFIELASSHSSRLRRG
jgi:DNA-binding transcriptional LysR family regulator